MFNVKINSRRRGRLQRIFCYIALFMHVNFTMKSRDADNLFAVLIGIPNVLFLNYLGVFSVFL